MKFFKNFYRKQELLWEICLYYFARSRKITERVKRKHRRVNGNRMLTKAIVSPCRRRRGAASCNCMTKDDALMFEEGGKLESDCTRVCLDTGRAGRILERAKCMYVCICVRWTLRLNHAKTSIPQASQKLTKPHAVGSSQREFRSLF